MARAVAIRVSDRQRAILENWTRSKADTSYRLIERSRIILMSAEGMTNEAQRHRLGVDRQRIGRWRTRWAGNEDRFLEAERKGVSDKDLVALIASVLTDHGRSGVPSKFTAEQLTQIIAVACELPADSGRPVTHWTPRELVYEVIQRGIVESISPRHIDRVLKGGISDRTKAGTG